MNTTESISKESKESADDTKPVKAKKTQPKASSEATEASGKYGGFKTLQEYHRHLRKELGAGHLISPITGEEIPNDINLI